MQTSGAAVCSVLPPVVVAVEKLYTMELKLIAHLCRRYDLQQLNLQHCRQCYALIFEQVQRSLRLLKMLAMLVMVIVYALPC
jgi:hypothetical protein